MTTKLKQRPEYQEGYEAGKSGLGDVEDNPYIDAPGTKHKRKWWRKGYFDGLFYRVRYGGQSTRPATAGGV